MHNLHLFVIKSESPDEACSTVETLIEDFGNENNWRTICGCVSEHDEVYINDEDGRYPPTDGMNTVASINEMVKGWIKGGTIYGNIAEQKIAEGNTDFKSWTSSELWSLEQYASYLKNMKDALEGKDVEEFNVLEDSYYPYEFAECGVTQDDGLNDGDIKYIVFIDMHD